MANIGQPLPFKELKPGAAFCFDLYVIPPVWFVKVDRRSYRREDERSAWPIRDEKDPVYPRGKNSA